MRPQVVAAIVVALSAAALTVTPAASAATHECDGLQVCVPIAGPWVVVPTHGTPRSRVEYQLECPRGYIVGGLDAELSTPSIDISFAGLLGSPVNPGITTFRAAVFSATYVGLDTQATASVRPHVGCIPASGGGGRVPTASSAVFPPGHPTTRRVRAVQLRPGATNVTQACTSGERLIGATHAIGFYTQLPPGPTLVAAVRTRQVVRGTRATVSVLAGQPVATVRTVVQIGVVCAGGK